MYESDEDRRGEEGNERVRQIQRNEIKWIQRERDLGGRGEEKTCEHEEQRNACRERGREEQTGKQLQNMQTRKQSLPEQNETDKDRKGLCMFSPLYS